MSVVLAASSVRETNLRCGSFQFGRLDRRERVFSFLKSRLIGLRGVTVGRKVAGIGRRGLGEVEVPLVGYAGSLSITKSTTYRQGPSQRRVCQRGGAAQPPISSTTETDGYMSANTCSLCRLGGMEYMGGYVTSESGPT